MVERSVEAGRVGEVESSGPDRDIVIVGQLNHMFSASNIEFMCVVEGVGRLHYTLSWACTGRRGIALVP